MHRPISLTLLLPALVGVRCGSFEGCSETERSGEFSVPWADVEERLSADGSLSEEACAALCEEHATDDIVSLVRFCERVEDPGVTDTADTGLPDPTLYCEYVEQPDCIGGRDHAAITSRSRGTGACGVLAWLEGSAHAEAASVKAFVALASELEAHGAPTELVQGCRDASGDEVAHARAIGALVDRRGGTRPDLQFQPVPARGLVDLAIENAVEGCVREVWAALLAHWQATHAEDLEIRAVMAPIAQDEARHGDLAWAIHAWATSQLDDAEQERVRTARDEAVAALREQVASAPSDHALDLGMPSAADGVQLLDGLALAVWAEA